MMAALPALQAAWARLVWLVQLLVASVRPATPALLGCLRLLFLRGAPILQAHHLLRLMLLLRYRHCRASALVLVLKAPGVTGIHHLLLLVQQWRQQQQQPELLGQHWQLQRCRAASSQMLACRRTGSSTCSSGRRHRVLVAFSLMMQAQQRLQQQWRQQRLQLALVLVLLQLVLATRGVPVALALLSQQHLAVPVQQQMQRQQHLTRQPAGRRLSRSTLLLQLRQQQPVLPLMQLRLLTMTRARAMGSRATQSCRQSFRACHCLKM
jgi:hypothetical protein